MGLRYAAIRLRVDPASFFQETQGVFIHRECNAVSINGVTVKCRGIVQATTVMLLSFIAFNLNHSVIYEDVLELLEALLQFRKRITKTKVKVLALSFL